MNDVAVKDLKVDEFGRGPQLPGGMNLCAGCEDVFTLSKYCSFCEAVHKELADRYGDARKRLQWVDRAEMGTIPFEPSTEVEPPSPWAVGAMVLGAVCSGTLLLAGLWYAGRALVGICLEHSK